MQQEVDLKKTEGKLEVNRDKLMTLQQMVMTHPDVKERSDYPVRNHFAKDLYARELFIPAGNLIIGEIHRHSSINTLCSGKIILVTEEGTLHLEAPYIVASKPGIKRVIFTKTNCTWLTVHGTAETDVDKIEEEFIAKDYSEVDYSSLIEETKKEVELCRG